MCILPPSSDGDEKKADLPKGDPLGGSTYLILVGQLGLDELAVQAGDVGDGLVLRADSLASTGIGAVAETSLFHSHHHSLCTTSGLYTALRKQGELRNLRRYEEHSRAVLTSCHASATADARCAVHSLVSILLRYQDSVSILSLTCADSGVTTGLDNLIEGTAVNHTVLNHGEGSRTPRLYGDNVAIVEATHVELTGSSAALGESVRRTVDVERAHTADTLAAVVIEYEGLLTFVDELLVQDVEHLEERGIIGNIVHLVLIEMSLVLGAVLAPELYCKANIFCHNLSYLGRCDTAPY